MLKIKSSNSDTTLKFHYVNNSTFIVSYSRLENNIGLRVYSHSKDKELIKFFHLLQDIDSPSKQPLTWSSLEGEFKIQGSCDSLGHVTLTIHLRELIATPEEWTFTGRIVTDYGLLRQIANDANCLTDSN